MKNSQDMQPPRWMFWFLRRCCPEELCETIEGDVIEEFQDNVERFGPVRAKIMLAWSTLKFIRLSMATKRVRKFKFNDNMMIQHYLKTASRHLVRNKAISLINTVGLAVGLFVCLVTGLYLKYEFGFDGYHERSHDTYRVMMLWKEKGDEYPIYGTPMIMADVLSQEVTGIDHVVRAHPLTKVTLEVPGKDPFMQDRVIITGPSFADVFKTETLKGDVRKALATPMTAVLTRSAAEKFFGTDDVIGKTFKFRTKFLITVGAVIDDLPANTHLPATLLLSHSDDGEFLASPSENYFGPGKWGTILGTETFVTVTHLQKTGSIESQLKMMADKYINGDPGLGNAKCEFVLESLADIHFDQKYGSGPWVASTDKTWLVFFGIVALLVLIMACINFINLTTAQAIGRAKEVGIRKSTGAGQFQLVGQFLTEAWIIAAVAAILAVVIVGLTLPSINQIIERDLRLEVLSLAFIGYIVAGIVVVGLAAGLYPAFVISRFRSISALNSNLKVSPSSFGLRKALVIIQFSVSACMIVSLLVVTMQVRFMRDRPLGFNKNDIIVAGIPDPTKAGRLAFELRKSGSVNEFTFSNNPPNTEAHWWTPMSRQENDDQRFAGMTLWSDENFSKMYGFELLAGRLPAEKDPTESETVKTAVNETLIKTLGYGSPQEALGKHFHFGGLSGDAEIIGVVRDFNTLSLHSKIPPVMISQFTPWYSEIDIKIPEGSTLSSLTSEVGRAWKTVFPETPFDFRFLDETMDMYYKSEVKLNTLFEVLAGVAIAISCLGLWGLATYTAQQRKKEVSIRKVLGATIRDVLILLSRDMVITVAIAFAISIPLSWFMIDRWLEEFAFHVNVQWEPFAITGIALILLASISIMWHTLKAAVTNPTESLRGE